MSGHMPHDLILGHVKKQMFKKAVASMAMKQRLGFPIWGEKSCNVCIHKPYTCYYDMNVSAQRHVRAGHNG